MKRKDIIKNLIILFEAVVCAIAMIIILPNNKASGMEQPADQPVNEIDDSADSGLVIGDYVNVGDIPSTNQEMDSFIDNYLKEPEDNLEEEQPDANEAKDDTKPTDANKPQIDKNDWRLLLVNKQHYIPDNYEVSLVNINGSKQVDERIAGDLAAMLDQARTDGVALMIVSAYRSNDRQTSLFNNKVRKNMGKGMPYMDAYSEAAYSVTIPGCSEHQLGLALDILGSGHSNLTESFEETTAGIWLKENCADYGFILRYPKGKEYVTGIIYEPWHFRYVGKKYAKEIMDRGITLEEYLEGK